MFSRSRTYDTRLTKLIQQPFQRTVRPDSWEQWHIFLLHLFGPQPEATQQLPTPLFWQFGIEINLGHLLLLPHPGGLLPILPTCEGKEDIDTSGQHVLGTTPEVLPQPGSKINVDQIDRKNARLTSLLEREYLVDLETAILPEPHILQGVVSRTFWQPPWRVLRIPVLWWLWWHDPSNCYISPEYLFW